MTPPQSSFHQKTLLWNQRWKSDFKSARSAAEANLTLSLFKKELERSRRKSWYGKIQSPTPRPSNPTHFQGGSNEGVLYSSPCVMLQQPIILRGENEMKWNAGNFQFETSCYHFPDKLDLLREFYPAGIISCFVCVISSSSFSFPWNRDGLDIGLEEWGNVEQDFPTSPHPCFSSMTEDT